VTSKPKRPAVAAAGTHAAKLAKSKTATAVPKPTPERKASAEPPTARELVARRRPFLPEASRIASVLSVKRGLVTAHRVGPGFLPLLRPLHPKLHGVHRQRACVRPTAGRADAGQGPQFRQHRRRRAGHRVR